jgi:hypothetical protein
MIDMQKNQIEKQFVDVWLVDEKQHKMCCIIEDGKRIVVLPKSDTKLYGLWCETYYAGGLWKHELFKHVFCYQRSKDNVCYRYFLGFGQRVEN